MNTADAPLDLALYDGLPSAVLVIEVEALSESDLTAWGAGPLPVVQPSNATMRSRGQAAATDADARRTLVAEQQADVLYGGPDGASRRCHRPGAGAVSAIELLQRSGISLLAAHLVDPDPSVVNELLAQSRRSNIGDSDLWRLLHDACGTPLAPSPHSRARTIHFADQLNLDDEAVLVTAYALITGMALDDPQALQARSSRHQLTIQRPDWSALVMRDGAAFVAHQTGAESFAPSLRVFAHTIHLDALLLALLQRESVNESGRRAVKAPLSNPAELQALEQDHFEFKRKLWRTSLTLKRTAPVDDVLRAFQEELLTERDLMEVEDRVQDGARLALSKFAQRQDEAQHRLNDMVQTASVIIGSFVFSFTAAPVIAQPSWALFLLAAVVGLVVALVSFGVVRWFNGREGEGGS